MILYFFDPSVEGAATLGRLDAAAAKSSGALSVLGISRGDPREIRSILGDDGGLASIVAVDNKARGAMSAFGLKRKLPAAVIIGPGGRVAAILSPVRGAGGILMASADAFISLLLPSRAGEIYGVLLSDYPDEEGAAPGAGYAAALSGDTERARAILKPLSTGSSAYSGEAHAAIGFLEFTLGRDSAAMAACRRVSQNGFAEYVTAMVNARMGRCETSTSLFGESQKRPLAFRWQEALVSNMAARAAEERQAGEAAVGAYRRAASLAPLNPTINANLLAYHWDGGNDLAAKRYAQIIESVDPGDSLAKSLVTEFESHLEFRIDTAARKRLKARLAAKPAGTSGAVRRAAAEHRILIPDIAFAGCVPESSFVPRAAAGLLRRSLEDLGGYVGVPRAEMLFAADNLHVSEDGFRKPDRLLKVANAFSADLVTLAEVGNYSGKYFINIRIAEVGSGKVVAVTSEKFLLLEELPSVIRRSASRLSEKVKARPGG